MDKPTKLITFLLFAVFCIWFIFATSVKIWCLDVWWHLKAGQYIVESRSFIYKEMFSFSHYGKEWIDLYWCFQALLYLIYKYMGWMGVILLKSLLMLSGLLMLLWSYRKRAMPWLFCTVLIFAGLCFNLRSMARPQVISYFLLCVLFSVLHHYRENGGKIIFSVPAIFLLWVNSHGIFAVGGALLVCFLAGETMEALGKKKFQEKKNYLTKLSLASIISGGVCFVNPYFHKAVFFPFYLYSMISGKYRVFSYFREFSPANFFSLKPQILGFDAIYFLSASLLVYALMYHRDKIRFFDIFTFAFFSYIMFKANRNMPLSAIAGVNIIFYYAPLLFNKGLFKKRKVSLALSFLLLAIMPLSICDFATNRFYRRTKDAREFSFAAVDYKKYPYRMCDFILRHKIKGRMFNDLDNGGYYIYRLSPYKKVFIDGRGSVYSPEFYRLYFESCNNPEIWKALNRKYNFEMACLDAPAMIMLFVYLQKNPAWRPVYFDGKFALFVKSKSKFDSLRNEKIELAVAKAVQNIEIAVKALEKK